MPMYVSLIKYTPQGITNIKDSPDRVDAAAKAIEDVGGKMHTYVVTMGAYDGVAIMEFPDDETAATVALGGALQGNARLETMRAFSPEEFRQILSHIG